MAKIPKGKDLKHVIYVQLPNNDVNADESRIFDTFTFLLDPLGQDYFYQFGHIQLKIFNWMKY